MKIGLMRSNYEFGYSIKQKETGKLEEFRQSLNDSQWQIAVEKVMTSRDLLMTPVLTSK